MVLALLSDIHGNIHALDACLQWIQKEEIDGIVYVGDYVSDFPHSHQVLTRIRETMGQYRTWIVRGNREQYMLDYRDCDTKEWKYGTSYGSLLYTYESLEPEDFDFMERLPRQTLIRIQGTEPILVTHGSPRSMRDLLNTKGKEELTQQVLNELPVPYMICGHSHKQFILQQGDKVLMNPGSVCFSISGDPGISFATIEWEGGRWIPQLRHLSYNIEDVIESCKTSGLMEKGSFWTRAVVQSLRTGVNHQLHMVKAAQRIAKEAGVSAELGQIPLSIMEQAFYETGIEEPKKGELST